VLRQRAVETEMSVSEAGAAPAPPDFGLAAADYAKHRQGYPEEFFRRLEALQAYRAGTRVLDVGTGTGLLARALAERGCVVTGVDPSAALLEQARAAGGGVTYVQATAEATALPDAAFDLVAASTCWHWFDREAAAREAMRLLAPGGRLLIAELDWHFTPGSIGRATWELIDAHRPRTEDGWPPGGNFQYPAWTRDLARAGFTRWEAFAFTCDLAYTRAGWMGRVRASAGVAPVMDAPTLARFDAAMAAMLAERLGRADTFAVGHKVFALLAAAE
jgi:SAM-dependent methyltransferase